MAATIIIAPKIMESVLANPLIKINRPIKPNMRPNNEYEKTLPRLYKTTPANFLCCGKYCTGSERAMGPHIPTQWKLLMKPNEIADKKVCQSMNRISLF